MKVFNIDIPKSHIIESFIFILPFALGFLERLVTGSSVILSQMDELSIGDAAILAVVVFLVVEFLDFKSSHNDSMKELDTKLANFKSSHDSRLNHVGTRLDDLKGKVELIKHGQRFDEELKKVKHPYFVELIDRRLHDKTQGVFVQKEATSPTSRNTFGSQGIKTTANNLKCVSFMKGYWEDKSETPYMEVQKDLIKRDVKIQRLFIVNDDNRESCIKEMEYQDSLGIETAWVDQSRVEEGFKEKDYLVQDDMLLVDLTGDDHANANELITVDVLDVRTAIEQFTTNWGAGKKVGELRKSL